MRRGVTLIELLFVVMIIAILMALSYPLGAAAVAQSRVARTRVIVAKINQHIMTKWEGYRTRAVPIKIPAGTNPSIAAWVRLCAMRELQRCEMPDRITDVMDNPSIISLPAIQKQFRRRAASTWTSQYDGAECLYLILAAIRDGEDSALGFFSPQEIGDVDGDGMHEILDGFGRPIEFLRWAPGYVQENGPVTEQTKDFDKAPDYFDPMMQDGRWRDADTTFAPYALRPLVFSPGPDGEYKLNVDSLPNGNPLRYQVTTPPNDPYFGWDGSFVMIGTPTGTGSVDNITNHDFGAK